MHELILAFLKQNGQTTAEALAEGLQITDAASLAGALHALVEQGVVKRSPRGNYYAPGQLKPVAKPPRVRSAGAVVAFGVSAPGGRGFEADNRLVMPGDVLANNELVEIFRVSIMGGIRVSRQQGCVIAVSSVDNHLYKDRWNDGVFMYTGEGRHGDQTMTRGNLALHGSPRTGTPVLLFFKRKTNHYEFQGEVQLAGPVVAEQQPDENGLIRRVFIFPLELVDGRPPS